MSYNEFNNFLILTCKDFYHFLIQAKRMMKIFNNYMPLATLQYSFVSPLMNTEIKTSNTATSLYKPATVRSTNVK